MPADPIQWPDTLVTELAERRCLIFMGAGATAGCVAADGTSNPPDWPRLLEDGLDLLNSPEDQDAARECIEKEKYLDAAEIIFWDRGGPPFSQFIRSHFVTPEFRPSESHQIIRDLDAKIVITTNYDKIYDQYCEHDAPAAYNTCRHYDSHLLNEIRSTNRVILKAHGCVSDPSKIVLTRSSYFEARRQHPNFYAVLDALFLVHTILFIGAGLNDPDIQLTLENTNLSAPSSHPHYALVPRGRHAAIKSAIKNTYNIEFIEYDPADNHQQAIDSLGDLKGQIDRKRSLPH